jgi:hypothetical protein
MYILPSKNIDLVRAESSKSLIMPPFHTAAANLKLCPLSAVALTPSRLHFPAAAVRNFLV